MGMGQNETTGGPQVVVFGSIYQAFILGTQPGWVFLLRRLHPTNPVFFDRHAMALKRK